MFEKEIAYVLIASAVLSLLAACGPAASPTPTEAPAATPMPTATLKPTEAPTGTPALTPTAEAPGEPVAFREDFEGTLEGWQKGSDVPEDPDRPGEPVFWAIEISPDRAASGASSARFTLDGKQDDGTIWLMRPFTVAADGSVRVRLAFDLWSASESFNTLARVAAYAGPELPTSEGDFDTSQAANLVEGWRTYDYAFDVPSGAEGQVWVALGISVVWETEVTYFIDEVRVDIGPAEEGQPHAGDIAVEGVEVTDAHVIVRGTSSLPEGTCVSTELWADGALQPWWPSEACVPVQQGKWELMVPLDPDHMLQPGVHYMVRAYQPGGPNVVSTFPFDLGGPPTPPSQPPEDDPTLLLPESAEPLHRASADMDGDGTPEEIVLTGWGGGADQLGYDFLQLFVIAYDEGGEYVVAWQSEQLPKDRAEALDVRDVNGDGLPEVLSLQAMGAAGETLYVLGWRGDGYGWLSPQGGRYDGQTSFGENGARVEDTDGDGLAEILASYGPAAGSIDVYGWDGQAFVYQETLSDVDTAYERRPVSEARLSLEVPSAWMPVEPGTWAAPENEALRLGVQWADLEPPQEPEAAMLPKPAQTLESWPVELSWGSGRWFTMEVYEEAEEGAGQAPVKAVEYHVLVVVDRDGGRRAIDVYASAPTADQLAGLVAAFERAIESVLLQ